MAAGFTAESEVWYVQDGSGQNLHASVVEKTYCQGLKRGSHMPSTRPMRPDRRQKTRAVWLGDTLRRISAGSSRGSEREFLRKTAER
jgi:hypothetical protein